MWYASIQKFINFILSMVLTWHARDKGNKLKGMNAIKENENVPMRAILESEVKCQKNVHQCVLLGKFK